MSGSSTDSGAQWLHEEIKRRIAAKATGSGGRHARPDGADPTSGPSGEAEPHDTDPLEPANPGGVPVQPPVQRPRWHDPAAGPTAPIVWSGAERPEGPAVRRPPDAAADPLLFAAPLARAAAPPNGKPHPPTMGAPGFSASLSEVEVDPSRPQVDEVVWSARSLPPAPAMPVPTPPPGVVTVPEQRTGANETAARDEDRVWDEDDEDTVQDAAAVQDTPEQTRDVPLPAPDKRRTGARGKRTRVVLSERKGAARPVRTVVEVEEGTPVGRLLASNFISSQLMLALWFALVVGLTIGMLPVAFALFPVIGRVELLGLRLPWLLLGVAIYPFLLGLAWWHTRAAERIEQDFADVVQK